MLQAQKPVFKEEVLADDSNPLAD